MISGQAAQPVALVVDNGAVTFVEACDLWGMTVGAATDALQAQLGADSHVAAIGPAGENLVRFASIVTDRSYQASRMGMGAVMGAKQLKAVVLRPGDAPPVFDRPALERLTGDFGQRIAHNDLSLWQQRPPGFSCWIYLHGLDAALCADNYQQSFFAGLEAFKEEAYLARPITELGCPGCPNKCIKAIHPLDGDDLDPRASGIHQEIAGAFGPAIGVGDLDAVLRANNLCNQLGLDPTSLGFTIAFGMELFQRDILRPEENGGQPLHFGDAAAALTLVEDIAYRRGLGGLLAEGTQRAAERIGGDALRFAMHVKGLEIVPFEPRSQTNLALGYAVAPIGPRYDICEHDWDFDTQVGWEHSLELSRTLGILERVPMDFIGPQKVRTFKALLTLWSAADALDLCIFAIAPTRLLSLEQMAQMVRGVTGWETSSHELMRIGERRLHLMQWYNRREGLSAADDHLPERFYHEAIADGPRAGDRIDRDAFHAAIATFYTMMGWDAQGTPTPATLYDAGLEWVMLA